MSLEHEDSWPDVVIVGLHVLRQSLNPRAHDDDEQGLTWQLQPGLVGTGNTTMVAIGDLTLRSAQYFAGVQVYAFLRVRGLPSLSETEWDTASEILKSNAGWLTHPLYDYAATIMRSMVGNVAGPTVPMATPDFELVVEDLDAGDHRAEEA